MRLYLVSIADVETYLPVELTRDPEPASFDADCREGIPVVAELLLQTEEGIDSYEFQRELVAWLVKAKGYQALSVAADFHIPEGQVRENGWQSEDWLELLGKETVERAEAHHVAYMAELRAQCDAERKAREVLEKADGS